ncbi:MULTISPECIES: DUF4232 domain-containing protein [unclassified Streptomyces]|uniref:DUF4232 domain-containing protein n=1 Tax=unclassified Streptomyces TaxID=2593676 RepID=UPI0038704D00
MDKKARMNIATGRRVVSALIVTVAGMALTACGPGNDDAGSTPKPSRVGAADSSADSLASNGPRNEIQDSGASEDSARDDSGVDSTSQGDGDAVAQCESGNLKVAMENREGGGGMTNFQLSFQNTGDNPCSLTGFPGVSFRGRDGVQIGDAASRDTNSPTARVTLVPNGHAVAEVQARNGQSGLSGAECQIKSVAFLRVYTPGSKDQFNIPLSTNECSDHSAHGLRVGAVHSER